MEDEDRFPLGQGLLARADARELLRFQQSVLDVGKLRQVDRVRDVTSLVLVVESAVNDVIPRDPLVREVSALESIEL